MGARDGALKKLISIYKYDSVRAAGVVLAELLADCGDFGNMKIVALPTIAKHIRERGFDHSMKLAQNVARRHKTEVVKILMRSNNAVQVGASEEKRAEQAKTAYILRKDVDLNANYLLIDDVWTTGSSMLAACGVLKRGGCKNINIAVIAKSG